MIANRLAFAAVAVGCVLAAGVGGYVATRQSAPAQAAAKSVVTETPATAAAVPQPTADSDTPAAPAAAPPVAERATPAPVRRSAERPATSAAARPAPLRAQAPATEPAQTDPAPVAEPVLPEAPPLAAEVQPLTPAEPPVPPAPLFEELVVPAENVIGLQNETPLSSDVAQVEDPVEARVTRDVRVDGKVAIPSGTRALGSVTAVTTGGKFRERAHLSVRFHTLVLADGTRLPISTEAIFRDGDAPNGTAKVGGGAVAGAILGAIIGGAKGAAVGATAGAGAGTAAAVTGGASSAEFPVGTPMTIRLLAPVTITVEQ